MALGPPEGAAVAWLSSGSSPAMETADDILIPGLLHEACLFIVSCLLWERGGFSPSPCVLSRDCVPCCGPTSVPGAESPTGPANPDTRVRQLQCQSKAHRPGAFDYRTYSSQPQWWPRARDPEAPVPVCG